nr:radical SAM protein [Anaerobacterium chartisolvens]
MKISSFLRFSLFGISTIVFKRRKPILATIILTDKCNLTCKHCAVNNIDCVMYSYTSIQREMHELYNQGIRILFFCGGETFLWEDDGRNVRSLVVEAKRIGFLIVNVVTNGTFRLDLPEADLILLSLDGAKENHNKIRGNTYDDILRNIEEATSDNICLYMAINRVNIADIEDVCEVAAIQSNVRAVSFNFHTPYPGTESLSLTTEEKRDCLRRIENMMERGYPVFNLKSAFPNIADNSFKTPCYQCLVVENGRSFVCGRCVEIPGLCERCGYFFAAEYSMVFTGSIKVILDMLGTYLKYV